MADTVSTKHEEYEEWEELAEKCRTLEEGEEELKEHRLKYLPPSPSMQMNPQFYNIYVDRASLYNATAKIKSNYAGAILRRDPVLFTSDSINTLLDDASLSNETVYEIIRKSVNEVINPSRYAVLVDFDNDQLRPKIVGYSGESVINWFCKTIRGKHQLTMVVLEEEYCDQDPRNPFKIEEGERWRVLYLDQDGNYAQRIYYSSDARWEDYDEEIYPTISGQFLNEIPITFFNASSNEPCPEEPLLLDVVNMNLSHFKTSAELEHALYWSAMPTPVVIGMSAPETPLVIGCTDAWILPDKDAKVQMLEFSGASISAIQNSLKEKETKLEALGAKLLPNKVNETATAASIRQGAETATLIDVVNTLEVGWDRVLRLFTIWAGEVPASDRMITFNRDFTANKMSANELTAMVSAWEKGGISTINLVKSLIEGEIIDPNTDPEKEAMELEAAMQPVNPQAK